MKVYIKNKMFSWGGGSSVMDENKNQLYKVKGKVFSVTKKKRLYDLNDNKLYTIRNKWRVFFKGLTTPKAYIYDADDNKIATLTTKFINFNNEYFVQNYKDEIKIEGKFASREMKILRNGEIIGYITRNFAIIGEFDDRFQLEANEEDIPFLIALVIAMDNIIDSY